MTNRCAAPDIGPFKPAILSQLLQHSGSCNSEQEAKHDERNRFAIAMKRYGRRVEGRAGVESCFEDRQTVKSKVTTRLQATWLFHILMVFEQLLESRYRCITAHIIQSVCESEKRRRIETSTMRSERRGKRPSVHADARRDPVQRVRVSLLAASTFPRATTYAVNFEQFIIPLSLTCPRESQT